MELNLEPVKVDLQIETPSLERGAFYSLCFITENDEAPRTLEVKTLSDLLDNGYTREDLAYNFCLGVFAQQGIESVYIRAKRSYETYEEAFSSDSNDDYYYLVIESKDSEVISDFNDFVVSSDDYKLQFYSSNEEPVEGRKLVHYFFDRGSDKNDFYLNKVMGEPDYIEESPSPEEPEEPEDPELEDAFTFTAQFPEGGGDVGVAMLNAKQPWIFKDADTGVILADSFGIASDNVYIIKSEDLSEIAVFVGGLGSDKRTFSLIAECDEVLLGSNVEDAEGIDAGGNLVEVLNYYSLISNYGYRFTGVELRVPNFLPRNVTSTDSMFSGCQFFNQDISSWDVSSVTNMSGMFSSAYAFNQPLNSWDVSNVTDMTHMFSSTGFDQPLGLWDVSNVTEMDSMFSQSNMSQDLSVWCVANIPSYPQSFASFSPLGDMPEFHPQWGTCPAPVRLDPYDPNYQPIPRMAAMFIQDEEILSPVELQQQRLAYPEGAWIGSCGDSFPSRVNWLHKYLSKVDVRKRDATSKVPPLSTTTAEVMKRRATVGSGLTTQGIIIHEQVSLDWIKWALGRKVWKTLYNNERINATPEGLDLVVNDVKEVLNLAIEEEMLSEYRITEVLFDRHSNNLSLKFSCKLMETILFVDISGSLYY